MALAYVHTTIGELMSIHDHNNGKQDERMHWDNLSDAIASARTGVMTYNEPHYITETAPSLLLRVGNTAPHINKYLVTRNYQWAVTIGIGMVFRINPDGRISIAEETKQEAPNG